MLPQYFQSLPHILYKTSCDRRIPMRRITVVFVSLVATIPIVGLLIIAYTNLHFRNSENNSSFANLQLSSKPRILCWILTGTEYHQSRAIHVKNTWGSRCTKLLFMSSELDEELGTIVLPNVQEGRDWLWAKTKEAFKYVWEHHRNDADWFLKADDDTYVFIENLGFFLREHDPEKPGFFGCRLKYQDLPQQINYGGPGYVLSKEALRVFIEESLPDKTKCKQENEGDEDTEISICLANSGVNASKTTDDLGEHRFMWTRPLNYFGPGHGQWDDVMDPLKEGLECCSSSLVSFHYVTPDMMYLLDFMAYKFKLN